MCVCVTIVYFIVILKNEAISSFHVFFKSIENKNLNSKYTTKVNNTGESWRPPNLQLQVKRLL